MKNNLTLRAACGIALVTALWATAMASEGTLLLDGRVLVPNGEINDASVTERSSIAS